MIRKDFSGWGYGMVLFPTKLFSKLSMESERQVPGCAGPRHHGNIGPVWGAGWAGFPGRAWAGSQAGRGWEFLEGQPRGLGSLHSSSWPPLPDLGNTPCFLAHAGQRAGLVLRPIACRPPGHSCRQAYKARQSPGDCHQADCGGGLHFPGPGRKIAICLAPA